MYGVINMYIVSVTFKTLDPIRKRFSNELDAIDFYYEMKNNMFVTKITIDEM